MAQAVPPPPGAADGASGERPPWRRASDSRFVWSAPSPSPAEVADLELRFPDIVQVPSQALEDEASKWEKNAILARSISRWVPPDAIIREFRRGGVPGEMEAISLAHRCIIFRFQDLNAMAMILGRPWVVNGQPIATEVWRPEFVPAVNSVPSALLWIRLPQLPMEFWTDPILRSIVLPAGEFQFSDASTMAKTRGGFARVCVRIDLTKPLRPGARIRGKYSPFWQQFSYEHLEGFCANCGSLHYSDPCSPLPDAESSAVGTKFGPWMAAVRQPRPSPASESDARRKTKAPAQSAGTVPQSSIGKKGTFSARPVLVEEWRAPSKVARRRPLKTGVIVSSIVPGNETEGNSVFSSVPGDTERAGLSVNKPESSLKDLGLNIEGI